MKKILKRSTSKITADHVPNGTYQVNLTAVKAFTTCYGERMGFEFTISRGNEKGKVLMRSTATNLTPQSKLAEVIRGLLGRDLTDHECEQGFDPESLIGRQCWILVQQAKNKSGVAFSNIDRIF